jgi:PAS domain S-box-containing protein
VKLFWKICSVVFISFVTTVSVISYIFYLRQVSGAKEHILKENEIIGNFLSKEIEQDYLEYKWPFESLKKISERSDFLFWWIIKEDGTIHLADKASFMATNVANYFPRLAAENSEQKLVIDDHNGYGVFIKPLDVGKKKWSFWLGFSLKSLSQIKSRIFILHLIVSLSSLIIIGGSLYISIKHFTEPVADLIYGTEKIGKGDLNHRVRVNSSDELGMLATSFNRMTAELQKTTVSKNYMDNVLKSMAGTLIVVTPDKRIRTINRAACELLGYEETELLDQPVDVIFGSDKEMPFSKKNLRKLLKSGELRNVETFYHTKNGSDVPILFNASVMKNEDDELVFIVCTGENISKLKAAEAKIKTSLKEKEVLLKEIHHRVKNNMQVVSSLLNLQSRYVKDEETRQLFKESQDRVRSMALIHEKLYQSEDLSRIDFAEYVRNLVDYLFRSYGANAARVTLKTDIDGILLGIHKAIPCGLIINELVSNSLKHAFPGNRHGEIRLDLHQNDDRFELVISDDGVGFPKGLDFQKTESLGLQLVNTLALQLEGTIELDSNGGGTSFRIMFGRQR